MSTSGERSQDEDSSDKKPAARPLNKDGTGSDPNERTGGDTSGPNATTGTGTGESSDTGPRDAGDGNNMSVDTAAKLPKPSSRRQTHIVPTTDDILMGRGWPYQKHPGNQKMRSLVEEHKVTYNSRSRSGKGELVKELLRMLRKSGSRFLIRSERGDREWEIASKGEAYEKVCHALRGKPKQKGKTSHVRDPSTYQSMDVAGVQKPNVDIGKGQLPSSGDVTMPSYRSAALVGTNVTGGIRSPISGIQGVNPSSFINMASPLNPLLSSSTAFSNAGSSRSGATAAGVPRAGNGNRRRNLIDHSPAGRAAPSTGSSTNETTEPSRTSPSSGRADSSGDDAVDLPDDLDDANPAIRLAIRAYLRRKRDA